MVEKSRAGVGGGRDGGGRRALVGWILPVEGRDLVAVDAPVVEALVEIMRDHPTKSRFTERYIEEGNQFNNR